MTVVFKTESDVAPRFSFCANHGKFSSSYIPLFDKWTKCPDCARVQNAQDAAKKKKQLADEQTRKIERIFSRACIPRRYLTENFDTYIANSDRKKYALHTVRNFSSEFEFHLEKGTNLILSGYTGTGKGHLAISAAKVLAEKGHTVFFTTVPEMIIMLRSSWNKSAATSEAETLKVLTTTALLIIDDVGVGFNSEAERTQLFGVINRRYLDLKPTIFTTNLNKFELEEVMGERNFSRIRQDGKWISFDWEDFRATNSHLKLASSASESTMEQHPVRNLI